ncbi:MAG: hypothetical protein FWE31_01520 [Firmicutes bacterium]|nr:hypothetical protein [Bacillota bacterium]
MKFGNDGKAIESEAVKSEFVIIEGDAFSKELVLEELGNPNEILTEEDVAKAEAQIEEFRRQQAIMKKYRRTQMPHPVLDEAKEWQFRPSNLKKTIDSFLGLRGTFHKNFVMGEEYKDQMNPEIYHINGKLVSFGHPNASIEHTLSNATISNILPVPVTEIVMYKYKYSTDNSVIDKRIKKYVNLFPMEYRLKYKTLLEYLQLVADIKEEEIDKDLESAIEKGTVKPENTQLLINAMPKKYHESLLRDNLNRALVGMSGNKISTLLVGPDDTSRIVVGEQTPFFRTDFEPEDIEHINTQLKADIAYFKSEHPQALQGYIKHLDEKIIPKLKSWTNYLGVYQFNHMDVELEQMRHLSQNMYYGIGGQADLIKELADRSQA